MTTSVVRARTCEHAHVCVRRDWSDQPTRNAAACSGVAPRQVESPGSGRVAVPSRAPSGARRVATVAPRASAGGPCRLRPDGRQLRADELASQARSDSFRPDSAAPGGGVFGLRSRSRAWSSDPELEGHIGGCPVRRLDRPAWGSAACSRIERWQVAPTGSGREAVPSRASSGVRRVMAAIRRASAPGPREASAGRGEVMSWRARDNDGVSLVLVRSMSLESAV